MFSLSYGGIYKMPDDYRPPEETDLASNTEYPNLNSRDYAKRPLNRSLRLHSGWEAISLNDQQHAIIAANKLSGREWTGSLWGFENIDVISPQSASYKLQCNSTITHLRFLSNNILILALNSGKVQVWSTRCEMRNSKNPYCLFLVGEKCEHAKPITCMDVMKSNANKAVTGDKDGTLKVWDMGRADLFSVHTFRFAHTDYITGVDSCHKDASIFATCSLDKSALLWDDRLTRPAIAIYENHNVRFKNLAWSSENSDDNLMYLGDECGFVHDIDRRLPNTFLKSTKYLNRPIRKLLPNGHNLAIIGDSNSVKVANVNEHDIIYDNSEALHFLRDCVWSSPTELLTVGLEGKLHSHKIH